MRLIKIMHLFPESTPLLSMAVCGFQVKNTDEIALIKTAILADDNGIKGSYFIKIDDLDSKQQEIIDSIDICKKLNMVPPIIQPSDPNTFFRLPDLTKYEFKLENEQAILLLRNII
jgi:heterodisulfide reductase subunit A-like polyferredoxin